MAFLTMTRRETLRRAIHEILPVLMCALRNPHGIFLVDNLSTKRIDILWFSFGGLIHPKPITDLIDAVSGDFIDMTPFRSIFL
mmetsp:Transcript_6656/g.21146  ORF Transcript_6656/g.21146 Transcript_6656/m.21146 type:complete len:83 (-) Transcript_6656:604-852(-)